MKKIIYSMKIMEQLVERGYYPEYSMPNPKNSYYTCWIFNISPDFQAALDDIMKGGSPHER